MLAVPLALVGVLLLDGLVHPRHMRLRRIEGVWLTMLLALAGFGLFLALSGNPLLAAVLVLALQLLIVVSSNAKRKMLGEPLLFSDLALIGAVFRHPQFYFSALAMWQKAAGAVVVIALLTALAWLFQLRPVMQATGAAIGFAALLALTISLRLPRFRQLAGQPQVDADVAALGLAPTLLLYWLRWRGADRAYGAIPAAPALVQEIGTNAPSPEIIVAVQCESFADPVELFGDPAHALNGLERARADAVQWGNLLVSGFGAYTMRTEYGVLFGQEERALGFRRYDPFLTALDDVHHALPQRLGSEGWHSLFVHPHDMRFYNRHRILPAAGFAELVSESAFAPPSPGQGRYVSDAAVADKILQLAGAAQGPSFIYAVTIENHGPWSAGGDSSGEPLLQHYNRLVQGGDAMLGRLQAGLAALQRPALLAFFGDHRPSIPGLSEPGGDRHTPYVMLQFDAGGQVVSGANQRLDLTPAQLHHCILHRSCGEAPHLRA